MPENVNNICGKHNMRHVSRNKRALSGVTPEVVSKTNLRKVTSRLFLCVYDLI